MHVQKKLAKPPGEGPTLAELQALGTARGSGCTYSQNAMKGMPMTATFFVLVPTAKASSPPPLLRIRAGVSRNVSSVEWSTFTLG